MTFLTVIFYFLMVFWMAKMVKAVLFWVYLWQLKEYHIGRFLDHFHTDKGRKILLNWSTFIKILLAAGFLFSYSALLVNYKLPKVIGPWLVIYLAYWILTVLIIYLLDGGYSGFGFLFKKIKKPVFTKKTVVLVSLAFLALAAIAAYFAFLIFRYRFGFLFWLPFLGAFSPAVAVFPAFLLILDLISPLFISIIVLIFQPLAVLGRNRIIQKAIQKREQHKKLLVIGITGSYGKTSVKEFLYEVLVKKFGENKVLKTKEHQNSEVGISQCILNDLKPQHEIFICEMGAYGRGGIKLLCNIARPKIGILTGINEQHMATFGSQENIVRTKFELIENLPEDGMAILNGDNGFIRKAIEDSGLKIKIKNLKLYSVREKADIWAEKIEVGKKSVSFKVFTKSGESADFQANVLGGQNVLNILAVSVCAEYLGMRLGEIAETFKSISLFGAMKLENANSWNVIDSSYSANPDGVISDLDYLKIWDIKKVIILPCLIELGRASKRVHRMIGEKIAEVCDLAIITTKDRFKEIKEGALQKGMKEENILFLNNSSEIAKKLKSFLGESDGAILLEGRSFGKTSSFLNEVPF